MIVSISEILSSAATLNTKSSSQSLTSIVVRTAAELYLIDLRPVAPVKSNVGFEPDVILLTLSNVIEAAQPFKSTLARGQPTNPIVSNEVVFVAPNLNAVNALL